jgi:Uma2 family endonuclease
MNTGYIPRYTYADYVQWKEDWELINGLPYSLLPSPVIRHGQVQMNAAFQFKLALQHNKDCNCIVLSEIDWKINEHTVVRPDVMIICGEPKTDFLEFPPALILEILSPASRRKDRNIKFELYREQGVRYYLMADYERHILETYELKDNVYRETEHTTFLLEPGCQVSLDPAALWE